VPILRPIHLALVAALIGSGADGQADPSFDVVSVRQHDPKDRAVSPPSCLNGHLRMHHRSIYALITQAYNLRFPQTAEMEQQLPDWADTNRPEAFFDIEAKSDAPISEDQCWAMFRSLLGERFKLAMHWETKEGSVHDLVIAPGGHKMQKVTGADTERGLWYTMDGRPTIPPQRPVSTLLGVTMASLANYISYATPDRLGVIDKTGLEGLYKVNLAFSTNPLEYSDPDLQTALQKQLGLKLEKRKGPVKHFVLDHIQRPSPEELQN
jgi:uncharacterized protein (TIGR03435 family)